MTVPFMVLSSDTLVVLCLRLLINCQKGLGLFVIRLSPMAILCSLMHFLKEGSIECLHFL